MNSLSTKGPWYYEDEVVTLENIPGKKILSFVAPGHTEKERKANAALMATAPEMLEMLEFAADEIQLISDEQDGRFGGTMDKLLRVIAKAKGVYKL